MTRLHQYRAFQRCVIKANITILTIFITFFFFLFFFFFFFFFLNRASTQEKSTFDVLPTETDISLRVRAV